MKLNTTEKFLLIAQHPTKGKFIISDTHINYGISGSLLIEMSLDNRIIIEENKLILKSHKSSKDPIVSEISAIIKNSKKPRKIKYWVSKLENKSRKYKWIFLNKLEKDRLMRIEKKKFLGLFSYRRCYLIERKTRDDMIKQLKDGVLYKKELSSENIVLLGLIQATGMHKIFTSDKRELKSIKKKLKAILKDAPIAGAVDKTLKEMQAAIIGAMAVSIATTTVATSS